MGFPIAGNQGSYAQDNDSAVSTTGITDKWPMENPRMCPFLELMNEKIAT